MERCCTIRYYNTDTFKFSEGYRQEIGFIGALERNLDRIGRVTTTASSPYNFRSQSIAILLAAFYQAQGDGFVDHKDWLEHHCSMHHALQFNAQSARDNGISIYQYIQKADDYHGKLCTRFSHTSGEYIQSWLPICLCSLDNSHKIDVYGIKREAYQDIIKRMNTLW